MRQLLISSDPLISRQSLTWIPGAKHSFRHFGYTWMWPRYAKIMIPNMIGFFLNVETYFALAWYLHTKQKNTTFQLTQVKGLRPNALCPKVWWPMRFLGSILDHIMGKEDSPWKPSVVSPVGTKMLKRIVKFQDRDTSTICQFWMMGERDVKSGASVDDPQQLLATTNQGFSKTSHGGFST